MKKCRHLVESRSMVLLVFLSEQKINGLDKITEIIRTNVTLMTSHQILCVCADTDW